MKWDTDMVKIFPTPGTFWNIVRDWHAHSVRHIQKHHPAPDFDFLRLCRGQPLPKGIPHELKLYLYDQPRPISDFPINMLSWPIMSQRMLDCIWPLIKDCVEVFPAPLYEQNPEQPVKGWYVLNVIKVVDCIDQVLSTESTIRGKVVGYTEPCIVAAQTDGAHLFRYTVPGTSKVDFNNLICSYEIPLTMHKRGFKGIAFEPCRVKE